MSRAQARLTLYRWLLPAFLLLAGSPASAAEDPLPQAQLEQVRNAITQIQDWLGSAASDRSELEAALRASNSAIAVNEAAIASNEARLAGLSQQGLDLDTRSNALEGTLASQQDLIRQALRASHASGRESYLKLLLMQEDPSRSARMLRYYADFNQARLRSIRQYRVTLDELAATRSALESTRVALDETQQQLTAQQEQLLAETARRQALLEELQIEIASRSGELAQLTADQQRLEALLQQIEDAIASIPAPEQLTPFSRARGQLPLPVEGEPLNRFGAAYSDGNLHRQGIVLAAAEGSAVRAVHPGRVVFSDWLRGSGLLVVVDHGEGYMSLYANNGSLIKRSGDWVNRGEALATAGSDGGMARPGIYFEIRLNGQAQDPAAWWRP